MRVLRLKLYSQDWVVIAEFVLVMLATFCFLGAAFSYLAFSSIPVWNWLAFSFFILVKLWLEFYETYEDRRVMNTIDDEKLPSMCRRQAD